MFHPAFDEFGSVYSNGVAQVVWTRLVADLETPVSVYLKIAAEQPNSFLLESVEGGDTRGRYSIIGLSPDAIWKAQGDKPSLNLNAEHDPSAFEACDQGTLDALRDFIEGAHIDLPEDLPPMSAGVFGYMGYDAVRLMEHLPNENP
ncbi:MAG TPA: anthranilate synthase component I, partial [Rhodobiaceae bacterium]|nr:anthranilate synthase component I [Rhodobiaceae bacterium]